MILNETEDFVASVVNFNPKERLTNSHLLSNRGHDFCLNVVCLKIPDSNYPSNNVCSCYLLNGS